MDIVLGLMSLAICLVVAYLIYRRQMQQGDRAERSITERLVEEGHVTRARVDLLEGRLKDVLNSEDISGEVCKKIGEVFSNAEFIDILNAIDPDGNLKDRHDNNTKELTKRMMFFVIKNLFYFPYNKYKELIFWLRAKGYEIPNDLIFDSAEIYEAALTKVERLNRVGITCEEVDVEQLFSDKRPFCTLK